MTKKILVTGAAGFIGSHLVARLLKDGFNVTGVDNLSGNLNLHVERLRRIDEIAYSVNYDNWHFRIGDISDKNFLPEVFAERRPSIVVNLAAKAGVRNSIKKPDDYLQANIVGFFNVIEACKNFGVEHLIYASSSSVFGDTPDDTDKPLNFYAATKKSNEIMAHCYSSLFNFNATGLRFFTVYGAGGRPDMAYFKFAEKLRRQSHIDLYNNGDCKRDFTFIDDVIEGIVRVINTPRDTTNHKVYSLGCGKPVAVRVFAAVLAEELIRAGVIPNDIDCDKLFHAAPKQQGDALATCADTRDFQNDFNFTPKTSLRSGLRSFALWFKSFIGGCYYGF